MKINHQTSKINNMKVRWVLLSVCVLTMTVLVHAAAIPATLSLDGNWSKGHPDLHGVQQACWGGLGYKPNSN